MRPTQLNEPNSQLTKARTNNLENPSNSLNIVRPANIHFHPQNLPYNGDAEAQADNGNPHRLCPKVKCFGISRSALNSNFELFVYGVNSPPKAPLVWKALFTELEPKLTDSEE